MTTKIGTTKCEKCGKIFEIIYRGQRHCYAPCLPREIETEAMFDRRRVKRDCIMHETKDDGREVCTGLKQLYCGVETCKFYKPRDKE